MAHITNSENLDLSFVADFHNKMREDKALLIFKGVFNQGVTKAVLNMAESKMENSGEHKVVKKKVFNIMVECLQNISKHADEEDFDEEDNPIFLLGKDEEGYKVSTGNIVDSAERANLKGLLEGVNTLDEAGLKTVYQKIRKNNMLSGKGGAGLGLLDMARKAKSKLDYQFVDIGDHEFDFFTLSTFIRQKK